MFLEVLFLSFIYFFLKFSRKANGSFWSHGVISNFITISNYLQFLLCGSVISIVLLILCWHLRRRGRLLSHILFHPISWYSVTSAISSSMWPWKAPANGHPMECSLIIAGVSRVAASNEGRIGRVSLELGPVLLPHVNYEKG